MLCDINDVVIDQSHVFGCSDITNVCLGCVHLLNAAHGLKVDVVVFAGSKRGVPVAAIRLVVAHCERQRLQEIPGRKFCCEIIRQTPADGILIGHGLTIALAAAARLPPGTPWVYLLHYDLIGAVDDRHNHSQSHH